MRLKTITAAVAAALALSIAYSAPSTAQADPAQKSAKRETIYGYQMMTDAERTEYRNKMRNAGTY